MSNNEEKRRGLTRRQLVQRGAAASAALLVTACVGQVTNDQTAAPAGASDTTSPGPAVADEGAFALEPTPACDDGDDDPTLAQTEGPFYTPSAPERASFLEDGPGTRMVVAGRVLTTGCQPIAGALVDFWHADNSGQYDNRGFRFRGHQFTDEEGKYRLETIVPGLYPGRARHFHVKVQGQDTALLTTQLYFPDEPANRRDGIFHPALVMAVREEGDGLGATFDFVLA
jgi:protocatechuate 3,4-dioxygenase beta subunit